MVETSQLRHIDQFLLNNSVEMYLDFEDEDYSLDDLIVIDNCSLGSYVELIWGNRNGKRQKKHETSLSSPK